MAVKIFTDDPLTVDAPSDATRPYANAAASHYRLDE